MTEQQNFNQQQVYQDSPIEDSNNLNGEGGEQVVDNPEDDPASNQQIKGAPSNITQYL